MTISYKLSKDDYMDFVNYEASHRDDPAGRKKFFTAAVTVCVCILAAEFIASQVFKFADVRQLLQLSAAMMLVMLIGLYGMMSEKNRTKALYVKYGFKQVEKLNLYPKITIDFRENEFIISSDKSSQRQVYKYSDIEETVTLEHIFMLRMSDKSWQFISKKAFENRQKAEDFKGFIDEHSKSKTRF